MQNSFLIERLAGDFEPIPTLRRSWITAALVAFVLLLSVCCALLLGARTDLLGMVTKPVLAVRNTLLLGLGVCSAWTVIEMAYPQNSGHRTVWRWSLLLALVGAAVLLAIDWPKSLANFSSRLYPWHALQCVGVTLVAATLVSALLAYWLRRGAVTSLNRAAWLTGISGGAFGALAYSWHCPHEDPLYIGLWYALAVVVSACMTRLWVKPIIRW